MITKGKIWPRKSPYGPQLFFVKQKGKLRRLIGYSGMNQITKKNEELIPQVGKMFDRLQKAKYFSKMDLKTSQIGKTALTWSMAILNS